MNAPHEVEVILEGMDETNISSVLSKWKEINEVRKKLDELEDMMKTKIKAYLKERKWDKYKDDDTKISVSISVLKRTTLDKAQIEMMLSEQQLAQATKTSSYEKLTIVTPEARARIGKYVKNNKK